MKARNLSYLLGLDVGTTGVKAILIDETGKVIASTTSEYPLVTPKPLWSEQNPEDWWRAAVSAVRSVLERSKISGDKVVGIGLSGQMHGLVLLDAKGKVLRPAILWNDQRTSEQCKKITEMLGFERLLDLTGNPVLPGFTAPKIIWVRENEPKVYKKIAHFLLPKDYVRYRLTGELATDVADASGTSLFDVKRRMWSKQMFDALDIPIKWAPGCVESPDVSGRVTQKVAEATTLAAGTIVVGGAGDQAAQAIGTGIVREGLVSATLGTSGVVFAPTKKPLFEQKGRLHSFCHAVPKMWHVMGVMLAAGGSLRWYRDSLAELEKQKASKLKKDPYEILMEEAEKAPAGCEGLIFLPYLSGERTPHPDPNARGAFVGLTLRHKKSHMIRAILEGVGFGLRDSLELIRNQGIKTGQIRASGGGARSKLWRQILANIFNAEVVTVNVTEGAAYGAALLAGVGAKIYPDVLTACERTIKLSSSVSPEPKKASLYDRIYPLYRNLYVALKPTFDALASTDTQ